MRLAILSRNKNLHSVRRLLEEAAILGIDCDVLHPLDCQLIVDGKKSRIRIDHKDIPRYDAVLPRIGASITDYGLAVVRQFEALGVYVVNSSRAIAESRDKMHSLQILSQAGLSVPTTVLTRASLGVKNTASRVLKDVKGFPVVLKILEGTQGMGVMLVHTPLSLTSVVDTLRNLGQDVLIQKFLAEGAGKDFRVFVVGKKVVASMVRTAPEGEFRSNIHRGGFGQPIKLPKHFIKAAIQASDRLGLSIAGVDLMLGDKGQPIVIEVNSSPGFEGIERATGLNVARSIMLEISKQASKKRKRR